MVQRHASTAQERAQWAARMIAHEGEYGFMTDLSREIRASRPTLYSWRARGARALVAAFGAPPEAEASEVASQTRQVLTVLVEGHASQRGIQACLRALTASGISQEQIGQIIREAQTRAVAWFGAHVPSGVRTLAMDEIYANDRRGAYLNVVDAHSGAVWASEGPVAVDTESWTLILWDLQARGLQWQQVAIDGGSAMQAAFVAVTPEVLVQRDLWHVLQHCAQVQARLDRQVQLLVAQSAIVARQAARVAAGQRPRGPRPKTDVVAQAAQVRAAQEAAANLRFLSAEWRRLLGVVVLDRRGVLDADQRQGDLESCLALLAYLSVTAPIAAQADLQRLHTALSAAWADLVSFVPAVARVQQDLLPSLPAAHQTLLAWAWLRRATLGWTSRQLLEQLPAAWRPAARVLLTTWDTAIRVSSAVERWHSILRPHLAVHRTLSSGMLALLAVWHNHRVFPRGQHKGLSPLHLSGMTDAPADWLIALGYPPSATTPSSALLPLPLAA